MQAKVIDICRIMEAQYPLCLAEKWDNPGLQIGAMENSVKKVMVSLDLDQEILDQAVEQQIDLIITHHPLFFHALKRIDYGQPQGQLIAGVIRNNINVYTAHTNLDAASFGLNQYLAEKLGLLDIELLDHQHAEKLFKLVVYVPLSHEAAVRQAIGDAGAGHLGSYSHCSFRSSGTGAFLPLAGSSPFIGEPGKFEEVEEARLESIVPQPLLPQVISRMKSVHPYEELAYDIYPLENQGQTYSLGRIGSLAVPLSLQVFSEQVKERLALNSVRVVGSLTGLVQRIAVVSGAGAVFIPAVRARHCDLLVTGDLKYHEAREAEASGLAVIDAGHQGTEQIVTALLADMLGKRCHETNLEVNISTAFSQECIRTI